MISKQIISVMSAEREEGMPWVEPFMGSGKVISKVHGRRIGADVNHEMIALFKAIQDGWEPPTEVSEEFYYQVRENQDEYPDHLKGFISIGCSFGAKRWDSYAKDKTKTNYALLAHNSLMRLKPLLKNIELHSCDYQALEIPDRSLIYCDPPYANTSGYGFSFSHEDFYLWCKNKVSEGHYLFVSEYNMPDFFEEVWSTEVVVTLAKNTVNKKVERLYRLHDQPPFSLKRY
tara:strand:- start:100 stop:792 length:693 start_codon:yes stop_codon:yes gene_type:complete